MTSSPHTSPAGSPSEDTVEDLAPGGSTAQGEPAGTAPAPRSKMRGNWRSLALSMAAVAGVVLVLYAIVPRPEAVVQPPVDVTPVAQQVKRDEGTTVWIPQLGEPGQPWKATSVRYQPSDQGPKAWYAGYHRTDDDTVFVAVQQIPAGTADAQKSAWVAAAASNGAPQGTVDIDGKSWARSSTGGDPERRALVGELGGMTTVVSGLADEATLVQVTRSLRPYQG